MTAKIFKTLIISIAIIPICFNAGAQAQYRSSATVPDQQVEILDAWDDEQLDSTIYAPDGRRWDELTDVEAVGFALDTLITLPKLPTYFFLPAVYDHFEFQDTVGLWDPMFSDQPEMRWLEELNVLDSNMKRMKYNLFFKNPQIVRYNITKMPQAPKQYNVSIDPSNLKVQIDEVVLPPVDNTTLVADEVKKRHWIRDFRASLQFSQAYVSPNWYQGGNDNLNVLGQLYYDVKLNQNYHPNLLFDFTAQYKLGLNSAPDDSLRSYSISDDLLQLNTTFGIKAAKRWYYSFTGQFKTQMFNSYTSNTRNLRSAFLSPGELTAGIGMTYNYANTKKTFTFDMSLDPISYNLKICTNDALNETNYGIKEGHTTASKYGLTAELKLFWKLSYNISYRSRLFTFSDYSHMQADWEHTLLFEINKFLTTQVYAHLRYDTRGVPAPDTKWKKLQVKEILSIGFAYKFSSL